MPSSMLQSDFTAGELSPSPTARVTLDMYGKGCRTLRNFIVQSHGGAVKRPGFELLDALPGPAVLVPFVFNQDQAYCLVFGEGWLRVATHEGLIVSVGGAQLSIPSPYTLAQARTLSYTQSADVLFLACHGVAPHRLKRLGHANWQFEAMNFGAPIAAPVPAVNGRTAEDDSFKLVFPAGKSFTKNGDVYEPINEDLYIYTLRPHDDGSPNPATVNYQLVFDDSNDAYIRVENDQHQIEYESTKPDLYRRIGAPQNPLFINGATDSTGVTSPAQLSMRYSYHVTSVTPDGKESELSAPMAIDGPGSNNWQSGDYITVSWNAVPGADSYRVYKSSLGGRPGFVAETEATTWNDYNTLASVTEGVPKYTDPFPNGDYPGTVCIFEQRLVFASSPNRPQTVWMSKTGDYGNFAAYEPITADAPIELTIAGQEVSSANWMIALRSLIMGTNDMEWELSGRGEAAFSAMNNKATPQSYWGSSLKRALIIGNMILHVSSSGSQVRSLQYQFAADSYDGADISILASHLLEKDRIVDWTYQRNPDSIIWMVRSDGVLLGLTFQSEHKISAWHRHDTQGAFRAVCAIPHGFEHSLFVLVERDGATYLERMGARYKGGDPAGFSFLDSSMTYRGAQTTAVSGLGHMEGKTVNVLADGAVLKPRAVSGGRVTLDFPASVVTVGLPYAADLETMPVEIVGPGETSVALKKQINAVDVLFRDTRGLKAGLSFDRMQQVEFRTDADTIGRPPSPFTGIRKLVMPDMAKQSVTVCIRSDDPVPATVLAIISRIAVKA